MGAASVGTRPTWEPHDPVGRRDRLPPRAASGAIPDGPIGLGRTEPTRFIQHRPRFEAGTRLSGTGCYAWVSPTISVCPPWLINVVTVRLPHHLGTHQGVSLAVDVNLAQRCQDWDCSEHHPAEWSDSGQVSVARGACSDRISCRSEYRDMGNGQRCHCWRIGRCSDRTCTVRGSHRPSSEDALPTAPILHFRQRGTWTKSDVETPCSYRG